MAGNVKISKRRLTKDEAEIISKEIRRTTNIIGYSAKELAKFNNVFIAINVSEIVGILAYVEADKFIDCKIFIVRKKYRDKGYGKLLFDSFIDEYKSSSKPIYTVTKNPAVIHMIRGAGFVRIRFTQLPRQAIMHQLKMVFSPYRLREYLRKMLVFSDKQPFTYWIRK